MKLVYIIKYLNMYRLYTGRLNVVTGVKEKPLQAIEGHLVMVYQTHAQVVHTFTRIVLSSSRLKPSTVDRPNFVSVMSETIPSLQRSLSSISQ